MDESKDVLLEVRNIDCLSCLVFVKGLTNVGLKIQIYAPWCGDFQSLEPTYNKLAKHLCSTESIVIAKKDGTSNEHPRAKVILTYDMENVEFTWITIFMLCDQCA